MYNKVDSNVPSTARQTYNAMSSVFVAPFPLNERMKFNIRNPTPHNVTKVPINVCRVMMSNNFIFLLSLSASLMFVSCTFNDKLSLKTIECFSLRIKSANKKKSSKTSQIKMATDSAPSN